MRDLECKVDKSYDRVFANEVLNCSFVNGKKLGEAKVEVSKYHKELFYPNHVLLDEDDVELEVLANVLMNEEITENLDFNVEDFDVVHGGELEKDRKKSLQDMIYSQNYLYSIAGLVLPIEVGGLNFKTYRNRVKSYAKDKGYL